MCSQVELAIGRFDRVSRPSRKLRSSGLVFGLLQAIPPLEWCPVPFVSDGAHKNGMHLPSWIGLARVSPMDTCHCFGFDIRFPRKGEKAGGPAVCT